MEFNSIPFTSFINSIHDLFSTFSCFCTHPLFSFIVTLYTLILIYAPSFFLSVVLSPVLNSTGIILLFLLKLGANERSRKDLGSQGIRILDSSGNDRFHEGKCYKKSSNDGGNMPLYSSFGLESTSLEQRFLDLVDHNQTNIKFKAKTELGFGSNQTHMGSKPNSDLDIESYQMNVEFEHDLGPESNSQDDCYKGELLETTSMESSQVVEKGETRMEMDSMQVDTTMKFIKRNMKAPLEVIYEGEEQEIEDSNENNMVSSNTSVLRCEKSSSLLMYYPESETDSSSDDDSPLNEKWETHESVFFKWEAEEDEKEELIEISLDRYGKRSIEFCQDEEDNLIEIDIFPQEME